MKKETSWKLSQESFHLFYYFWSIVMKIVHLSKYYFKDNIISVLNISDFLPQSHRHSRRKSRNFVRKMFSMCVIGYLDCSLLEKSYTYIYIYTLNYEKRYAFISDIFYFPLFISVYLMQNDNVVQHNRIMKTMKWNCFVIKDELSKFE